MGTWRAGGATDSSFPLREESDSWLSVSALLYSLCCSDWRAWNTTHQLLQLQVGNVEEIHLHSAAGEKLGGQESAG